VADNDATNVSAPDSFAAFIATAKKGRTERELSDGMQKVIAAVLDTGLGGSITVKVDIKPAKDADGMVVVTESIGLKVPSHPRKAEMFFATDAGQLRKDDPRQHSLFANQENTNR
jgi:hypothetical protein